ncbi:MAG: DUF7619 domain-containing protein, partial [Armatimonadota bacterium]
GEQPPSNSSGHSSTGVTSLDPNCKSGPHGFGTQRWVSCDHTMAYTVHYENDPEKATAAAAQVHVTDQLDPNLNWSTFQITEIEVAGVNVTVPAGSQSLTQIVPAIVKLKDLNDANYPNCAPVPRNVNIEVTCEFNATTGLAEWSFVGRDPATGELADFLPPNEFIDDATTAWDDVVAPHGEGRISYSCDPKHILASGAQVSNVAEIVFDTNPPMRTDDPDGPWVNTIDAGAPSSQVEALPADSSWCDIEVNWAGEDDQGGSGVGSYSVYCSQDGGPFVPWLQRTTQTSAVFTGEAEHTYSFYSVARDSVGNVEPAPAEPDATVHITTEAPDLTVEMHAGWNMPSIGQPSDAGATFGGLLGSGTVSVVTWDAEQFRYTQLDIEDAAEDWIGRGMWALCTEEGSQSIPARRPSEVTVPVSA